MSDDSSVGQRSGASANPFTRSVAAFAGTASALAATTAFAPVGVVGARGWVLAYTVGVATLGWELLRARRPR